MIPIGMPHHNTSFELVTFDSLYEELSKRLAFMTR